MTQTVYNPHGITQFILIRVMTKQLFRLKETLFQEKAFMGSLLFARKYEV